MSKVSHLLELAALEEEQARVLADTVRQIDPSEIKIARAVTVPEVTRIDFRKVALALLIERDGPNCYLCGSPAAKAVIEHIIPTSRGGTNDPSNLAVACEECNYRKGSLYVSLRADRRPVYHRR